MTPAEAIHNAAEKYMPGDREFEIVLNAIALAESGGDPKAVGDAGNSIGLFQNNMAGGRGASYTKVQLEDPQFNAELAAKELSYYYRQGMAQGLKGANLVAYVSRTGQRPAAGNEWNAAKNYGRMIGQPSVATNEPQMLKTKTIIPSTTPTPQSTLWETLQKKFVPTAYAAENVFNPSSYTVREGDTLWDIAQKYLGSGSRWNQLGYSGNPRNLQIGTMLNLPTQSVNQSVRQPNTSTRNGPVYTPPSNYSPVKQYTSVPAPTPNYSPVQNYSPVRNYSPVYSSTLAYKDQYGGGGSW